MDKQFTEKIVAWLETPADERDYEQGALYLLQLNNNQIMYRNVTRNLKKHAEFIEYQIRKYVKFRLASLTHEQVEEKQVLEMDCWRALTELDAKAKDYEEIKNVK